MTHILRIRQSIGYKFRLLRRVFPMTVSGCLLLAASLATVWTQGIAHQDLVLLAGAVVVGAVELLLVLFVIASAVLAWRRSGVASRASAALQLETGAESSTGFAVRFPGWLPFVSLSWQWKSPAGIETKQKRQGPLLVETVVPECRALTTVVEREFSVGDFLGLARISWLRREPQPLRILPARLEDSGLAAPLGLGTGDDLPDPWGAANGDLVEMREYQPGDSPRMVRWKLFARTGKLLVRRPETAVAEQPSACVWLSRGRSSHIAAQAVRELLERGSFGSEFLLGAEGSERTAHGDIDAARDVIAAAGAGRGTDAKSGLAEFLREASGLGYSECLMFTGPDQAPEPREAAGAALSLRIVVCVKKLGVERQASWWQKFIFRREEAPTLESIGRTYEPLKGCGPVQIFEQRSSSFLAL